MILKDLIKSYGIENNRLKEDLVCEALDISWSELKTNPSLEVSKPQVAKIERWLAELSKGRPLAHLTGYKDFYKFRFKVSPDVLIPRPETEILVEQAVRIVADQNLRVLDLGAGSGCIGISIAKDCPGSQVLMLEKSPEAVEICRQNIIELAVANCSVQLCEVGMQDIAESQVDLIVANPPYIPQGDPRVEPSVHDFEPHLALYADDDGLATIKTWLNWAFPLLKSGGQLIFEFGKGQESQLSSFINSTDYSIIEVIKDYTSTDRFFKLKK